MGRKILYVSSVGPQSGGAVHVSQFVRAAQQLGHSVELISAGAPGGGAAKVGPFKPVRRLLGSQPVACLGKDIYTLARKQVAAVTLRPRGRMGGRRLRVQSAWVSRFDREKARFVARSTAGR